ncbi:Ribonuclease Z [Gracilaria domingensis]|nr:Ribonuclease Z [Gracilaria domingensis]
MHSFVEVIGSGVEDTASCVQLFFDDSRYLFECGDGTQRLFAEYGVKFGRLQGIYLSSLAAPSIGGLFGFLLTVADAGKRKLDITAPHGLRELVKAARGFTYRPLLTLQLNEVDIESKPDNLPLTVTKDENVTIQAIPVKCRRDMEIDTGFGAHYDVVSYVCRVRDVRGKFNPDRAIELGVKKGRSFGKLQKGENVVTDDGRIVTPEEVMSPKTPGALLLIISCPTVHHVRSLVSCDVLKPSQLDLFGDDAVSRRRATRVCLLVHLAPREVLCSLEYREWCDSFGEDVGHIPIHSSVSPRGSVFASQNEDLALLHDTLDNELFCLPSNSIQPGSPESLEEARELVADETRKGKSVPTEHSSQRDLDLGNELYSGRLGEWMVAECKLKFVLSPKAICGPDKTNVRPRFIQRKPGHPKRPWRETSSPYAGEPLPGGPEGETPSYISRLNPGSTAVRFFGTGACLPSKQRNVSSTMIDLFGRGGILLDCGEGTWGQMVRQFGLQRAQRALCGIKVIFVSHMHADHHLGLMSLLHERNLAMTRHEEFRHGPQLVIVGPSYLEQWLRTFQAAAKVPMLDRLRKEQRCFRFFDAGALTDPQAPETKIFADTFGFELGCVDVIHCPSSYGVVVKDCVYGWKIVYSGDTRPCKALAEAGKFATLAIHEATLEDDMSAEAKEKRHCTVSEALDVCATQMKAWRTILTHFSQRYPRIPMLDNSTLQKLYESRATVACDLMCVDLTRLEDLPRITAALRDTFPDEVAGEALRSET